MAWSCLVPKSLKIKSNTGNMSAPLMDGTKIKVQNRKTIFALLLSVPLIARVVEHMAQVLECDEIDERYYYRSNGLLVIGWTFA